VFGLTSYQRLKALKFGQNSKKCPDGRRALADLVPLDDCNRALVGAGLRRLRAGQGNSGLRALIEVSGRREASLATGDIGFAIGPRINAAGRLEDMALGIECLLEDDIGRARELAATLDAINRERRDLQQQTTDEAEAVLASLPAPDILPPVLVLHDDAWHAGVIGLVASKLAQRAHRPAFVFAPAQPGSDELRGSARSIPGLHIRDLLAAVDAAHPGLIARFGGHAMAAGLTLARDRLPAFEAALRLAALAMFDPALLQADVWSDGELAIDQFAIGTAIALRDGGHWGQGYPEPLFDGEFVVLGWRIVGERHLKLELGIGSKRLNAIHFGGWGGDAPPSRVRIAYRLAADDYRGGEAIQLLVVHREDATASPPG